LPGGVGAGVGGGDDRIGRSGSGSVGDPPGDFAECLGEYGDR